MRALMELLLIHGHGVTGGTLPLIFHGVGCVNSTTDILQGAMREFYHRVPWGKLAKLYHRVPWGNSTNNIYRIYHWMICTEWYIYTVYYGVPWGNYTTDILLGALEGTPPLISVLWGNSTTDIYYGVPWGIVSTDLSIVPWGNFTTYYGVPWGNFYWFI